MLKRLCLIISLSLIVIKLNALVAVVSNTVFYLPDTINKDKLLPYIETSWEIIPHTLHYKTNTQKNIVASVKTDIVYVKDNTIITEDHFSFSTIPRTNVNEIGLNKIISLRRYYLPTGKYYMKLKFTDENDTTNKYSITDSFLVLEPKTKPFFSHLQLLDTLYDSKNETVFSKNGAEQIPLNGFFLDDNKKNLTYYAELYQSKLINNKDLPVIERVFISKTEFGSPYQLFNIVNTIVPQEICLVNGTFNINPLLSGNYYLNVTLETKGRIILASNSLFFQRVNKHPPKEDTLRKIAADTSLEKVNVLNLEKTFVSKFTLLELKAILKMILPLADQLNSATIKGFLDKPDEMYMRYFIYNFFNSINKDNPAKAWKEYSEKVIQVNKLFKAQGTPGYETERGFYYLRYGAPTDMIQVENEPGSLPYEIWQYNTLTQLNRKEITNALFLFFKPNFAINDYILLHCTVGGETQNLNWRNQLYLKSGSSLNGNSRADDYFGGSGR